MSSKVKSTSIGPTVRIRGKISCDEDLVIHGRIDATIESTKLVRVDPDGVVNADIRADAVVISGVVVGNITAKSRAELLNTARVVGDISSTMLVINDGARVRGKIEMPGVERAIEEPYVEPAESARPIALPKLPDAGKPAEPARSAEQVKQVAAPTAPEAAKPAAAAAPRPAVGGVAVPTSTTAPAVAPAQAVNLAPPLAPPPNGGVAGSSEHADKTPVDAGSDVESLVASLEGGLEFEEFVIEDDSSFYGADEHSEVTMANEPVVVKGPK